MACAQIYLRFHGVCCYSQCSQIFEENGDRSRILHALSAEGMAEWSATIVMEEVSSSSFTHSEN